MEYEDNIVRDDDNFERCQKFEKKKLLKYLYFKIRLK